MEEDEVVHIKVFDNWKEDVVFDGKVSTNVTPYELWHLGCFRGRYLGEFVTKETEEEVKTFKGRQYVELIPSIRSGLSDSFSVVLYQRDDGVVRSSKAVPSCECVMMSLWNISHEECEKVFKCETLEELEINECKLRQIPNEIGKMKMLKNLRLNGSKQLRGVPEDIGELSNLKRLWIESCWIESLPKSIGGLMQLEKLELRYLQDLDSIPESIGQLSSLKMLQIMSCGIERLPKSIGGLKQLEKLKLFNLRVLNSIPVEIGCMSNLKKLEMEKCNIETLPKSMKDLKQLTSLRLFNVPELQLDPEIILSFSRLKELCVVGYNESLLGSGANAFCQMLKMSVNLCEVGCDWDKARKDMLHEALLENGSITEGFGKVVSDFNDIFARNKANHARAMLSVVCMMAIRRCRRGLNGVPREIIDMLAKMLWITRCDVDAWMVEERSEKRLMK